MDWTCISQNPNLFIQNASNEDIIQFITLANHHYHNGEAAVSDEIYDIIHDHAVSKGIYSPTVGASVIGSKMKLPVFMGSMNKIKPNTGELRRWKAKYHGPYVLSDKLDGISLLVQYDNGYSNIHKRQWRIWQKCF